MKAEESSGSSRTTRQDPNPYFVVVNSAAPTSISRTEATLKATADKGGSTVLEVWFEYGVGTSLNKKVTLPNITKAKVQNLSTILTDLKSDTKYSFRIVTEDDDGNRQYGQTRTFTTISSANTQSFNGEPSAETEGSKSISSNSATIQGFVSMNDYSLGNVFFVYGTSRSLVSDAEDYNTYAAIPVSKGLLSKKSVNAKFTGRNTVTTSASSLVNATTHYYRVCVEYADTGESPELECGQIESFTTLN